jgi:hypothetical protein
MISVHAHLWLFLLFSNAFENMYWEKFFLSYYNNYYRNILIPSTAYRKLDVLSPYFAIKTPDTLLSLNSDSSLWTYEYFMNFYNRGFLLAEFWKSCFLQNFLIIVNWKASCLTNVVIYSFSNLHKIVAIGGPTNFFLSPKMFYKSLSINYADNYWGYGKEALCEILSQYINKCITEGSW